MTFTQTSGDGNMRINEVAFYGDWYRVPIQIELIDNPCAGGVNVPYSSGATRGLGVDNFSVTSVDNGECTYAVEIVEVNGNADNSTWHDEFGVTFTID